MKLFWGLLITYIVAIILIVTILAFGIRECVNYIDNHGGIKTIAERIWEGKK